MKGCPVVAEGIASSGPCLLIVWKHGKHGAIVLDAVPGNRATFGLGGAVNAWRS